MARWRRGCRHLASAVAFVALVAFAAPAARAQAVYGSIAGTVIDSSGAPVAGAAVTITSQARQTVDTVVTNASGYYEKLRLLPGAYEVKAELSGFKAKVVSAVAVGVDSQTKVDLALELGDMTEVVTVASVESQLLKTDRADVATTFETKQVTELPVLDRNFTKFVLMTPGTQRLSWNHASSENPQGSIQTMVNGQHFSGTGFQLDGTENRDPILGIIVINPTLESIGESKITSQNYDAEFGQATAGVVSVRRSRARTSSTGRPSSSTRRTSSRRATRSRSRTPRTRSPVECCPRRNATSSAGRWAARSSRTSCSSSATTRAGATRTAARSCSPSRPRPPAPGTSAGTGSTSSTR